jgi:hypothetical protein
VRAALEMLQSDDAFAPAYACLHARFAIEALAYDRLQDYLFEVSLAAINGWTPKAVLNELLYTDSADFSLNWPPKAAGWLGAFWAVGKLAGAKRALVGDSGAGGGCFRAEAGLVG